MHKEIVDYINKYVPVTSNEASVFSSAFTLMNVKKRQLIIQPGFTAKYRYYILNGAFRTYVVSDKGQEHTISFAIDDWWVTDFNSYIYQQPATMFVIALEDSAVLQLDYAKEQELKKSSHNFDMFFRIVAERGLAFYQRRLVANLTMSAEERYDHFVSKYPDIVNRVPQYALASFLGMSTEFLSRIRNKKARKKS